MADITQWHTYRINWTTNQFQWLVDGVTNATCNSCWTAPPGFSFSAPYNSPFYIVINLTIGGNSLRSHRAALVKFSRKITSKNP